MLWSLHALFVHLALASLDVDVLKSSHISKPNQQIQANVAAGSSIPVWGSVWPTGIYWIFISVGTPPQRFPVAIDSGSPYLYVAGNNCDGCVVTPPNNRYDAAASSTARSLAQPPFGNQGGRFFPANGSSTSTFRTSYLTCDLDDPDEHCSISGRLFQDKVSVAGLGPVEIVLGSIDEQTRNFDQFREIDGVMGFFPRGPGPEASGNVFAQLVAAGLADNVWAMCINPGTVSNGTLTLGGVDAQFADGPVTYVPNVAETQNGDGFYGVYVSRLGLSGASIEWGQAAYLDTGTNILLLPPVLLESVHQAMCSDESLSHCEELWRGECLGLSTAELAAYPPLTFDLDGVTLEMAGSDYLLLGSPLAARPEEYCLGIRDGGGAANGFIFGDTIMRRYYIAYDLGNRRIGWGRVNEATCGSVSQTPSLPTQAQVAQRFPPVVVAWV